MDAMRPSEIIEKTAAIVFRSTGAKARTLTWLLLVLRGPEAFTVVGAGVLVGTPSESACAGAADDTTSLLCMGGAVSSSTVVGCTEDMFNQSFKLHCMPDIFLF